MQDVGGTGAHVDVVTSAYINLCSAVFELTTKVAYTNDITNHDVNGKLIIERML